MKSNTFSKLKLKVLNLLMVCLVRMSEIELNRRMSRSKCIRKDLCGTGHDMIWGYVRAFTWVIAKNQPFYESKTGILLIRKTNSMKSVFIFKKFVKILTSKYYSVGTVICTGHWHVVHIISLLRLCLVLYFRHFTVKCVNLSFNWDVRHKNERKLDKGLPSLLKKLYISIFYKVSS